ncbi:type IV secretion protein IcmB [Gammaproteobacteria bacterium]|nr:type IV secretion protein IcmB [Gammaproteobacteria bacterium]
MAASSILEGIFDGISFIGSTVSVALKKSGSCYTDLQTADGEFDLVRDDGTLVSIIEVKGFIGLVGEEEFKRLNEQALQTFNTPMKNVGHTWSMNFSYNIDKVKDSISENYALARQTSERLNLDLEDVLKERIDYMSRFCSTEDVYLVINTHPNVLTAEQLRSASKDKVETLKQQKTPIFRKSQSPTVAIHEIRDAHKAFVSSVVADLNSAGVSCQLLGVHDAIYHIRKSAFPGFTDKNWKPVLIGDKIKPKVVEDHLNVSPEADLADLLWPSLEAQLFPQDGEVIDLKTCRIGNQLFSSVYIDLYPKDVQPFTRLFSRLLQNHFPWKMDFNVKGGGLSSLKFKRAMASVLAFSSSQNRLINDAVKLLDYIDLETDDSVVIVRAVFSTWVAESGSREADVKQLRTQLATLARAIQGWGTMDVIETCGDPYEGATSSMVGLTAESPAPKTVASLRDVLKMMPLTRPASPWDQGSLLLRSPDGKPWAYQPGSPLQSTWIDIIYARPGSGKSVISSAINLGLCVQGGIQRLPRIAVIDIGPSSSGLVSLIKEALPEDQKHLATYIRFNMSKEYSINPFDTQLGSRVPLPLERSFLVNFISLLATPTGQASSYDGVSDLVGMVIDEAYKALADDGNPNVYTKGISAEVDDMLDSIKYEVDGKTSWWEVTDALFDAGHIREASLAQRNAVPLLSDLTSIARISAVVDLYGKITISTGENLIDAFVRMISSAVREYSVLSRYTQFDLGEARVVSFDLDEVAKSGGEAADRQTSVMYMLARFIIAKDFYLNKEAVSGISDKYRSYHEKRAAEIKEDQKRIVFDEFHRTAKSTAVRDQVLVDMREGRKWRVQVCVISQDLSDFDEKIVKFATSTFIMDAGPEQSIKEATATFGLSKTAQSALRQSVRGPREGGATFLGQFSTKNGNHLQLLTLTLGPVELWAFSTTSEDVLVRSALYESLGPKEGRRVLANLFPAGTAAKHIQDLLNKETEGSGVISEDQQHSVVTALIEAIMKAYQENPNVKHLG